MRPASRSVMCTSTASNPARSKAAAISTCPLTPCSRRMATRGRAPRARGTAPRRPRRCRSGTATDRPGILAVDARRLLLVRAVKSSRIDCIAWVVSDQMPRRMLRRSSNTVRPSRRRMMRSPRCACPSARTCRPGRDGRAPRARARRRPRAPRAPRPAPRRTGRQRIVAETRRSRRPSRRRPRTPSRPASRTGHRRCDRGTRRACPPPASSCIAAKKPLSSAGSSRSGGVWPSWP